MPIVRVKKHDRDYVVMKKTGLEDPKLSFKAKGMLAYLLSKPDNWTARVDHLRTVGTDGRDAVRTGLRELEDHGYIYRYQPKNEDGTFGELELLLFEEPDLNPHHQDGDDPDSGGGPEGGRPPHPPVDNFEGNFKGDATKPDMAGSSPQAENPSTGNPSTDNRPLISNEVISNEKNNNPHASNDSCSQKESQEEGQQDVVVNPSGQKNPEEQKSSPELEKQCQKYKTITGKSNNVFIHKLAQEHSPEQIDEKLDLLEQYAENNEVQSVNGFLIKALKEDWTMDNLSPTRKRLKALEEKSQKHKEEMQRAKQQSTNRERALAFIRQMKSQLQGT